MTSSSISASQSLISKHVLLAYKEPQQWIMGLVEPQHPTVTARKVWPTQDNRRDILTWEFIRRLLEVLVSIHRPISPSTYPASFSSLPRGLILGDPLTSVPVAIFLKVCPLGETDQRQCWSPPCSLEVVSDSCFRDFIQFCEQHCEACLVFCFQDKKTRFERMFAQGHTAC